MTSLDAKVETLAIVVSALVAVSCTPTVPPAKYDVIIRGGLVYDGSRGHEGTKLRMKAV